MKHSCEKISQLASDQLERKLTLAERVSMWFHFLMCSACKHYSENLNKLHQALCLKREREGQQTLLPKDKRIRINEALQTISSEKK
jgi:predicted anti-sigma-YlaC factor YlaD